MTSNEYIGATRYKLTTGHSDDAGLGGEGWMVRMSDHFPSFDTAQKWVKSEDYESLRLRFEKACARVTELESAAETFAKPARDADHCDYPDCEQHWSTVARIAIGHVDMAALRISHRKDWAVLNAALDPTTPGALAPETRAHPQADDYDSLSFVDRSAKKTFVPRYGSQRAIAECKEHDWTDDVAPGDGRTCRKCGGNDQS